MSRHPVSVGVSSSSAGYVCGKSPYIQALRGLAIAAVVLIHCLPQEALSVTLRPLLNWSVAMFLFLSGMLTSEEKIARGGVIKKRIVKVGAPYILWSAFYIAVYRPDSFLDSVFLILTGGASAQMYYLLVYSQLVLLTPLLFRLLRTHRTMLYALTPVTIALWEMSALLGFELPNFGRLFPMWLIYYLLGLEWERTKELIVGEGRAIIVIAFGALILQVVEGFFWFEFGDFNMATTQLRLSNMVFSMALICLFMAASESFKTRLSEANVIVMIGNASFGTYLCHMVFVAVINKVLGIVGISGGVSFLVEWAVVLACSVSLVLACQKIFPKRLLSAIGFV